MDIIERDIYALIASGDGIKAREIAKKLNKDRSTVNHYLYNSPYMKDLCYRDENYEWYGLIRQSRPHVGLGDYSGYYGTVAEFLELTEDEWFQMLTEGCRKIGRNLNDTRGLFHNLEQLIDSDEEARYQDEQELQGKIEEIFARGIIQAEAMNFIRGRSFVNTYLIIDEAQNMTPNQVKGIITRAGKGTKIVLLGDPNQIDRPFLDERTNGLSYASEYMKGSPLCYQITMSTEECERSELAMDAIRRL